CAEVTVPLQSAIERGFAFRSISQSCTVQTARPSVPGTPVTFTLALTAGLEKPHVSSALIASTTRPMFATVSRATPPATRAGAHLAQAARQVESKIVVAKFRAYIAPHGSQLSSRSTSAQSTRDRWGAGTSRSREISDEGGIATSCRRESPRFLAHRRLHS